MDPIRATGCALVALLLTSSGAVAQVYYRVEIGYSKSVYADIRDKDFGTDGVICGDATCSRSGSLSDVGNSPVLAGGAGWRFTPNVRGDVMLTYRPGYKLDKHDSFNPPATFKADVTSWSLLANEYYEFRLAGWTILNETRLLRITTRSACFKEKPTCPSRVINTSSFFVFS